MSGYKRVNYYELCRLCTSTEGMKIHIFKEEGRKRQLPTKIKRCLPLKIFDQDSLPKMICYNCATKLEEIDNFRQLCVEAEKMLQDFRAAFKNTTSGGDGVLDVYVKDSQSQIIESKTPLTSESIAHPITIQRISSDCGLEKKIVSQVNVSNSVLDESCQMPLHCAIPLKLNEATTSVVPVSVENISSLMQVVSNNEQPRIQQFKLPLQTEMTVIDEQNSARFSLTIPTVDAVTKENAHIIQSLQCAVSDDGSIDINKLQPVSFDNSVAVSLLPSPSIGIRSSNIVQNGSQVNMIEDDSVTSCNHCGKILRGPNNVCNHTVIRPATSTVTTRCETASTTVIQSATFKLSNGRIKQSMDGFSCDICEKPFRKKEHLLQHRKLHSGDRPYLCVNCGKSFSRKEHLYRHMLAHTGEKRHSCDFCGKTFSRKDNLHKHRKIHGFNGPYECELCGKSFIVQHYFLMHKANHSQDGDTEELPFQCDICKKGFTKEEFLNRHKVRHRVRNAPQLDESDISTLNPVAILSPSLVEPNLCIEETVYVSTQPATYSISTSVASNSMLASQTHFSADLTTDGQLLDSYRQLSRTIVS